MLALAPGERCPIKKPLLGRRLADQSEIELAIGVVGTTLATASALEAPASSEASDDEPARASVAADVRVRRLVEENIDFVFSVLRRAGLDEATADDATQQVFVIAARKLDIIEDGKERAFLHSVASHVAAQNKRRAARRGAIEVYEDLPDESTYAPSTGESLEELLDQRRAREVLDQILAAMPDKLREIFVLCDVEELTTAAAAALLDVPHGTAASRLLRAREAFDRILQRVQSRRSFRSHTP